MRFLPLLLLIFLTLLPCLPASATPSSTTFTASAGTASNPFSEGQSIPPVDKAMPLTVQKSQASNIILHFSLLDHVYLYRPQIKLSPLDANRQPLSFTEPFELPQGKPHQDDVYGRTEVYFHQLTLSLSPAIFPAKAHFLRVQYQGCLENVLCYPPQQKDIVLTGLLPGAQGNNADVSHADDSTAVHREGLFAVLQSADAASFASWAQGTPLPYVLLLFFMGGVLMAFTPCVFPMFPILLGILAGTKKPGAARGFTISLAYVLGMAVPYTLAGLLVALSGARFDLHAWLQQPAAILVAALIFVLLSLSMFGLYDLQLPARLRDRLGSGTSDGSLWQAVMLGAISGLIVSPCITPVLAGALLFVAAQGQVITGTLALFVLSLGMGLPLLVIGAGGASLLPRAGNFMEDIKHFFGLVLLLVAAWLAGRLLAPSHLLWVYGIILFGYAITHGATDTNRRLRQTINLLLLFYALLLMVGAAAGGTSLVTPLKPLTHPTPTATPISTSATNPGAAPVAASRPTTGTFETIAGNRLQQELAAAKVGRLPVLVDFFADWCTSCKELDKTTLSNPAVLSAMASFRLLRVDITDINATNRQLMQRFHILGLPCLVFFDTNGVEIPHARVLGYLNSQQWLQHMKMRVLPSI